MRFFVLHDPAPALAKVRCPVLAIGAELDLQVLPGQNLPVIEAALKQGGNKDVTVVRLPGLNHLLQPAKTGLPAEYAQIEDDHGTCRPGRHHRVDPAENEGRD